MAIILASSLNNNYKDEQGNRHAIALLGTNEIVKNIKKYTLKFESLVIVANDPTDYELNDAKAEITAKSFAMTGMAFNMITSLDNRNIKHAKKLIEQADLIILSGGRLVCQLEFFKKIGLKQLLKSHKGLTIGISAGTMNLCEEVFNFPESKADIDNGEPRWLKGLGFHNQIIIPHFKGETKVYYDNLSDIDVANDFLVPFSQGREFIAYMDDSYILIDNGKVEYYGTFYKIKNGKIIKENI